MKVSVIDRTPNQVLQKSAVAVICCWAQGRRRITQPLWLPSVRPRATRAEYFYCLCRLGLRPGLPSYAQHCSNTILMHAGSTNQYGSVRVRYTVRRSVVRSLDSGTDSSAITDGTGCEFLIHGMHRSVSPNSLRSALRSGPDRALIVCARGDTCAQPQRTLGYLQRTIAHCRGASAQPWHAQVCLRIACASAELLQIALGLAGIPAAACTMSGPLADQLGPCRARPPG